MTGSSLDDKATPSALERKFGEDADLYAEVRAEAAAAAGDTQGSSRWQKLAEEVEAKSDDSERE